MPCSGDNFAAITSSLELNHGWRDEADMKKPMIITILVVISFLFSAIFFKVISAEDCWMPDGKGGWVKHGVPAGSLPAYPSPVGDTPILMLLIWWFLSGSLVSSLCIYLYLRFSKASPNTSKSR
jgi:hypothetical protein